MSAPVKVCKDCVTDAVVPYAAPTTVRPAPYPGPRCYTHHQARRKAVRLRAAEQRVERVHGISPAQYDAQYVAQGGVCVLCKRATGRGKRRLAVDHDHALAREHDHPNDVACPDCWRGLLCSRCNDVLAHFRDDPALLIGAANYLIAPPTRTLST